MVGEVNVSTLGEAGAEQLVDATREALGHTPPLDSLAGEAKRAAEAHPEGGSFPVMDGDVERIEEAGRQEGEKLKAQESPDVDGEQTHSVNGLVGDVASLKLSDVRRTSNGSGLASPENFAMKHGVGTVLRSSAMRRTETGDSVEIIGDVIG
ncbi:hypothetical protein EVJ58_g2968 [Rhodofomes roseus]|uniref:Uncharacterized protein n=1 Tax=Rhodofomes roseus TaxID=34475 RepID=A0A4Y9YQ12_9APHY|nr:hypothetical protein EVJ58_g2968 [Rhodofomes roseus]